MISSTSTITRPSTLVLAHHQGVFLGCSFLSLWPVRKEYWSITKVKIDTQVVGGIILPISLTTVPASVYLCAIVDVRIAASSSRRDWVFNTLKVSLLKDCFWFKVFLLNLLKVVCTSIFLKLILVRKMHYMTKIILYKSTPTVIINSASVNARFLIVDGCIGKLKLPEN